MSARVSRQATDNVGRQCNKVSRCNKQLVSWRCAYSHLRVLFTNLWCNCIKKLLKISKETISIQNIAPNSAKCTIFVCQLLDDSRWKAKCLTPGNPCHGPTWTSFFRQYISPNKYVVVNSNNFLHLLYFHCSKR